MDISQIKALTFDIFGTVTDWRTSVALEGEVLGRARGIEADWTRFADEWRGGYEPAMRRVRLGELPWANIDVLHRMILDELLDRFSVRGLSEDEKDNLNQAWHRLMPWPDAVEGVQRLKRKYVVAALSNGNMALLTNMAKNAGLPWDCILSAELAKHYKPDPEVYQTAAELLGLKTEQVLMVAAHKHDLAGAKSAGMKTAFIARPLEFGPDNVPDTDPDPAFDLYATDFLQLADILGA